MPDSFFQKSRKRAPSSSSSSSSSKQSRPRRDDKARGGPKRPPPQRSARAYNDDDGDDDDGSDGSDFFEGGNDDARHRYEHDVSSDEERDAAETPAEARVRLAKAYIDGLKNDELDADDADAAASDAANIAARLQKDVSEHSGKQHIFIASRLKPPPKDGSRSLLLRGGHRASLTAAVASGNGKWVYTAAKDGNVFRWRMEDGRIDVLLPRGGAPSKLVANGKKVADAEMEDSDVDEEKAPNGTAINGSHSNGHVDGNDAASDAEMSSAKSKSSGASRRKARRRGAALQSHPAPPRSKATPEQQQQSRSRLHAIAEVGQDEGHRGEIWSLALSSDGKRLATGGQEKHIGIWTIGGDDPSPSSSSSTPSWTRALTGHKDSISGLRFRHGSYELYTSSLDRQIKLFAVDQLSYIETLFGHQECILSLDVLRQQVAVSAGGRDRTARWWKVRDESQLVFRGGARSKLRDLIEGGDLSEEQVKKARGDRGGAVIEGSVECVAMIDDSHFLSGGDSGAISLWSLGKKKPIFTRAVTHGFQPATSEHAPLTPRWITSLACLPYGDVFASGSWDGSIRLWQLDRQLRNFKPLFSVKAPGFVNSLQLLQPPKSAGQCVKPELYRFRVKGQKEKDSEGEKQAVSGDGDEEAAPAPSLGRKESVPPILIAALGSEPRMGRWMKDKSVQSAGLIVPLTFA